MEKFEIYISIKFFQARLIGDAPASFALGRFIGISHF